MSVLKIAINFKGRNDYTPSLNPIERNTLSHEICDSKGDCDTALLTITVTPETPTITLSSLSITGDDSVNESSNADYTATAFFSDGSSQNVTSSAGWSENSAYATINSIGKLTTSSVPSDQSVTIQASYTYNGATETATKRVTIVDVSETNCTDGVDNDGDGSTDCADTDCIIAPICNPETVCDDGIDNDSDGLTDCDDLDCMGVDGWGATILSATFDTDSSGFTYQDDTFRSTSNPVYASGNYDPSGGFSGGGLHVALGGVDTTIRNGISE
jgi:hypothetical protein